MTSVVEGWRTGTVEGGGRPGGMNVRRVMREVKAGALRASTTAAALSREKGDEFLMSLAAFDARRTSALTTAAGLLSTCLMGEMEVYTFSIFVAFYWTLLKVDTTLVML